MFEIFHFGPSRPRPCAAKVDWLFYIFLVLLSAVHVRCDFHHGCCIFAIKYRASPGREAAAD